MDIIIINIYLFIFHLVFIIIIIIIITKGHHALANHFFIFFCTVRCTACVHIECFFVLLQVLNLFC